MAGRRIDGGALYLYLTGGAGRRASDGIPALAGLEVDADALAARFVRWFETLVTQPSASAAGRTPDAWVPDRLEYQFNIATPARQGQKVFAAEEYFQGQLDWYNVDLHDQARLPGPPPSEPDSSGITETLIPTPVSFEGMPNTRWWAFEDGKTNFGEVKPDTTDLAKLLLMEFGLVYANDWFLVPCTAAAPAVDRRFRRS